MSIQVSKHHLKQGEEIVDSLYDNGYFTSECKREDLRKVDELLGLYIQSAVDSALNLTRLTRQIRESEIK